MTRTTYGERLRGIEALVMRAQGPYERALGEVFDRPHIAPGSGVVLCFERTYDPSQRWTRITARTGSRGPLLAEILVTDELLASTRDLPATCWELHARLLEKAGYP